MPHRCPHSESRKTVQPGFFSCRLPSALFVDLPTDHRIKHQEFNKVHALKIKTEAILNLHRLRVRYVCLRNDYLVEDRTNQTQQLRSIS